MKRIFKYELPVADRFSLLLPDGAEILGVQTQHHTPVLWAVVDPEAPMAILNFEMRGTGHEVGDVGPYIGTLQLQGGHLVLHVFFSLLAREVEHG